MKRKIYSQLLDWKANANGKSTGLFLNLAFNEQGKVPAEIYERLLHGKLETNMGMIAENIVAQSLATNGHRLFFYHRIDNNDAANNMEIDFLITKNKISSKHNICPIEVKSGKRYALASLEKCRKKFAEQIGESFVLHPDDVRQEDDITYLPIYMACCL